MYTAVLIIGKGIKESAELEFEKLIALYKERAGYVVIGDGLNYLEIRSLDQLRSLFKVLNLAARNNPLQIHLWSCYARLADKDYGNLPAKSILFTYGDIDQPIVGNIAIFSLKTAIQNLQARQVRSPYQQFSDNMSSLIITQQCTAQISGRVTSFSVDLDIVELLRNPQELFASLARNFSAFAASEAGPLVRSDISEEQYRRIQLGSVIFRIFTEALDTKRIGASPARETLSRIINYTFLGENLLQAACKKNNKTVVQFLLENRANPNNTNNGITPLISACLQGNKDIVEQLLRYGAKPDELFLGASPIFIAIQQGNIDIVKLLLRHNASYNISYLGLTPCMLARDNGHENIAQLIEYVKETGDRTFADSWARVAKKALLMRHAESTLVDSSILTDLTGEYVKIVQKQQVTSLLNKVTGLVFTACLKDTNEYRVDALIEKEVTAEARLSSLGIGYYEKNLGGKDYFIIEGVNLEKTVNTILARIEQLGVGITSDGAAAVAGGGGASSAPRPSVSGSGAGTAAPKDDETRRWTGSVSSAPKAAESRRWTGSVSSSNATIAR